MSANYTVDLLEELDSISKIHTLHRPDIDGIMHEFSKRIVIPLKIERISAWLFNAEKSAMISIGEYDTRTTDFQKNSSLPYASYRKYIDHLHENKILISSNVLTDPRLDELVVPYSIPNGVISLMDIPLRMHGELIGVLCFEKTGNTERVFTDKDQFFALSISNVFSSVLEARKRRILQIKLDKELEQRELLLKELKHRIKNNLSVVSSLIRLQSERSKDAFHRELFLDCNNRVESISSIYDLIYKTDNIQDVDFEHYISAIIEKIKDYFKTQFGFIEVHYTLPNFQIDFDMAIPIALIINEVVTNAYKHAFIKKDKGEIHITATIENNELIMTVYDDGIGFTQLPLNDSLGMSIVDGLVSQINGTYSYIGEDGSTFKMRVSIAE